MSDLALTTQLTQNLAPANFTREKNISKLFDGMATEQRDGILSKVIQSGIVMPNIIKIKTVQSKDAKMFYAGGKNKTPYEFSITVDEINQNYYSIVLGGVVANFLYQDYMKPKSSRSTSGSLLYATKPKPLQNFNEKELKAEDFLGNVPPDLDAVNLILSQKDTGIEPVVVEHSVYVLFVPKLEAETSDMFIGAVSMTVAQWLAPLVKETILPLLGGGNVYNKPNTIDKSYILADLLSSFEPDQPLPQISSSTSSTPTEELTYVAFANTVNMGGTNPTYVNFPTKADNPYFIPQTREQQIYMLPFLMVAQIVKDNLLKIVESEYSKALESNQRKEVKENTSNSIPVTAVMSDSVHLQPTAVTVQAPVVLPAPTPLVQPAPVAPPVAPPPVAPPIIAPPVPVAPPAPAIIQHAISVPVVPMAPPVPQAPPAPVSVAPPQMPAGLGQAPSLDFINPLAIPDLGSF